MSLALALLLSASLPAADAPATDNLDFHLGTLDGWEGEGFYVTTGTGHGPSLACGVCSSDRRKPGRTGYLHHALVVPPGAGVIHFTACVTRPRGMGAEGDLDVVLVGAGKRIIPKQVNTTSGWQPVSRLLAADRGRPREYIWNVSNLAGQTVRIALVDEDKRPGCHIFCSGFHILPADEFEPRDFGRFMLRLVREHRLPSVSRFDSDHFIAISNADEEFTERRLRNCELIYGLFYEHFRSKGFRLQRPPSKLMVAVFDSQTGFEAYVGQGMPAGVTGLYHPRSNRLVVYDFGQNRSFLAQKRALEDEGRHIGTDMDRHRFIETVDRKAREFRTGTNIATVMHEVAHQLSFNCGMLNRDGDVPLWLGEGLACYCEATDNGAWEGIGEANPERLQGLAAGQGHFISLHDLLLSDGWLRDSNGQNALLGYAQSWALFRMLMEERPAAFRSYLALIYSRRTPDHRLDDFVQAFGTDLNRIQLRYEAYIREVLEQQYHPHRK